jgi:hypothetical protein
VKFFLRASPSLAFMLLPGIAPAWGPQGHQEIGAIADQLIAGKRAEKEVKRILGASSLQMIAVWADCAKGVTTGDAVTFKYDAAAETKNFPECKPFASPDDIARFETYVSHNWEQCGPPHRTEYCHHQYHYADVAVQRDHYALNYVGTNKHDVVHSINAAIAVLKGQTPEPPFSIAGEREALMLLAHFVGDVHQPLHVAAVYLNADGRLVDPDATGSQTVNDTVGGNNLMVAGNSLHWLWDAIPPSMEVGGAASDNLLQEARFVTPDCGDLTTWSTAWADDTIRYGGEAAFGNLNFKIRNEASSILYAAPSRWDVIGADEKYWETANSVKFRQLAKAGARLAEALFALWPDDRAAVHDGAPKTGYLSPESLKQIRQWLPAAPAERSSAEAADLATYMATRQILLSSPQGKFTPRAEEAASDDVYKPALVLDRFRESLGFSLTPEAIQTLTALFSKVERDGEHLLEPMKLNICEGGRVRPFVAHPNLASCLSPFDIARHREEDILQFHLDQTGSYPSGHGQLGMLMALVLGEVAPDRADAVLARGLEFGESRVICGFHYESDVAAGRLAGAVLFARLRADEEFARDMKKLKTEVAKSRSKF